MPIEVLWRLQTPGTRLRSVTPSRPRCAPLTDGAAAGTWRAETAASGLYGGDVAPKCVYIWDDLPQSGGVVACLKRRPASAGCGPPHGRRRRRHLEGGNGRVGSTWRGCSCGFGPDLAPRSPSVLTRHNRVERSTGQSPSVESQGARSRGQPL